MNRHHHILRKRCQSLVLSKRHLATLAIHADSPVKFMAAVAFASRGFEALKSHDPVYWIMGLLAGMGIHWVTEPAMLGELDVDVMGKVSEQAEAKDSGLLAYKCQVIELAKLFDKSA